MTEATENTLWNALRALEESQVLLQHLAQHADQACDPERARALQQQERKRQKQAALVRQAMLPQKGEDIE